MKKALLSLGLLLGVIYISNAQQTISFEAAEGFTQGSIYNQNGWTVTGDGEGGYVQNQIITSTAATDGVNSLKISQEEEFPGQESLIVGGFYTLPVPVTDAEYSFSFDIKISQVQGSNFGFMALTSDLYFVNRVEFDYEQGIYVVDTNDTGLTFAYANATWNANTWYNIRIEGNNITSQIKYYINNELKYTGSTIRNGAAIASIRFVHDNYDGYANIDNFKINVPLASVNKNLASNFIVSPNPTSDIVNISSSLNTNLTQVNVIDLNGRTVKAFNLGGVANAQINIGDLSSGVYMLNITSEEGTTTKKVVKN